MNQYKKLMKKVIGIHTKYNKTKEIKLSKLLSDKERILLNDMDKYKFLNTAEGCAALHFLCSGEIIMYSNSYPLSPQGVSYLTDTWFSKNIISILALLISIVALGISIIKLFI